MARGARRGRRAFTSGVVLAAAVVALAVGVGASRAVDAGGGDRGGGTGSKAASAGKRVDVIVAATDSPFWQTVLAGAEQAGKDYGVDVGYFGPTSETDVGDQVQLVENSISRGVDSIVLAATSASALNTPVRKARKAGISVTTTGLAVTAKTDGFVRTSDEEAGSRGGARMCELLKEADATSGSVAMESSAAGLPTLQARRDGFTGGLKKGCPRIKVLSPRYNKNDASTAASQVNDALAADDSIVGVFGDNNTSGVGAARAVKDNKAADRIPVVAFDADPSEAAALKDGSIDVLIVQDAFFLGYQGVVQGVMANLGSRPPSTTAPAVALVERSNMSEPAEKSLLNPPTRKAE